MVKPQIVPIETKATRRQKDMNILREEMANLCAKRLESKYGFVELKDDFQDGSFVVDYGTEKWEIEKGKTEVVRHMSVVGAVGGFIYITEWAGEHYDSITEGQATSLIRARKILVKQIAHNLSEKNLDALDELSL
jgi:hypothetical protein